MIAPEIKAQVTHVMKHMKTFGDDLRELGVDLADVNPRLLLRNARAQDRWSFAMVSSSMEETGPRHVLVDVITR